MYPSQERLLKAADRLDHLYEGAKHTPADLVCDRERSGVWCARTNRKVAHFFWGGAAEVFLTLGPAVLPILAAMLRAEAKNAELSESISELMSCTSGENRMHHLDSSVAALAFADHILKEEA